MSKTYDVLTVMDLCVDTLLRGDDVIPEFGQKEKLVEGYAIEMGGSCSIFACQTAKLGLTTAGIGVVGDDIAGRIVLDNLRQAGVRTELVETDPARRTGFSVALCKPDDRAILTYIGTIDAVELGQVTEERLRGIRHLHIGSYFLMKRLQPHWPDIARTVRRFGGTVSLDTNWDPEETWDSGLWELLPHVDIFLPNESELKRIAKADTVQAAVEKLQPLVPIIALKQREKGATAFCRGEVFHASAFPVDVVDEVGAGDSFDAGFVYGFLSGQPIAECLRLGCACGSMSTRGAGGTAGQATLAELEAMNKRHHPLEQRRATMDIKPDIDIDCAIVWETEREREFALALPQAEPLSRFLALPVHSSRKSMLFVGITVKDEHGAEIHRTEAVVEWAGAETLHLLFPAAVRDAAHRLVLRAGDSTFAGTVLHIGSPEWREQRPPIPVNDGESLLDIFMNRAFYELDMWHKEPTGSPASTAIGELKQEWNFAALRLLVPKRELGASVAFSRKYDQSLAETQALAVCVSVVPTARFSLNAVIDGKEVALVAGRPGAGLEEIRVPLSGGKLERVTIRLDAESSGEHVAHLLWFMLERRGADPARSHEVTGMNDIAPPAAVPDGLPKLAAGLLFGEAELTRLRQTIASGKGRRLYEEILAEAESNLLYRPESYVGRYFPVYWGGQGIERLSSPYQETRRWFSALVYSALAYVLGGELKHGLLARRALLAVIQCEEWCAGFVSRIPRGITGYRATFTEAQLTQAVALCYDMVGGLLSDEEKRAVEDAIYDKSLPALDMYMRRNREGYLLESNQGAVYALGIVYACLVANRSHPDAMTILERQAAWFRRMMSRYYKPDGTTGEGMAYWEYTTHFALETLLLLARHSGEEVSAIAPPQFKESMRYVQHMRSLDDSALTFLPLGDSRAEKFRFMGPSLQFFARYYGDAAAHWMWSRHYDVPHPPASSFFGQEQGTGQYTTNGLLTLLLLEDREAAAPDLPPSFRFDRDRVFWRTGNAESDIALFFEGGPQTFEHTHFDKGEFVIQAFGDYVAADPGMITYDKPEHVYYVQSAYHNIVTIRGANQSYKDAAQAVVLRACESDADASFLRADLANSYKELERYDRMLVFVRPHYFILLDELAAEGGGIEWNFHSCGAFGTEDGKRFVAEGSRAGLVMQVACDVPLTHHMSRYSDEGRTVSHNLVLAPGETATAMNLAAVLAPYPLAGGAPAIDVAGKPVAGGAGFTVTGPWGRDRIVVRTGPRQGGSRITVIREGDAGWERSFE